MKKFQGHREWASQKLFITTFLLIMHYLINNLFLLDHGYCNCDIFYTIGIKIT